MALNVNRTTKLQWKLDTIKNCTYLQCTIFKQSILKGTIESVINGAVHLLIFEKKISRCYVLIKGGYANQFLDFLHFLFLLKTIVVVPGYMLYMLTYLCKGLCFCQNVPGATLTSEGTSIPDSRVVEK